MHLNLKVNSNFPKGQQLNQSSNKPYSGILGHNNQTLKNTSQDSSASLVAAKGKRKEKTLATIDEFSESASNKNNKGKSTGVIKLGKKKREAVKSGRSPNPCRLSPSNFKSPEAKSKIIVSEISKEAIEKERGFWKGLHEAACQSKHKEPKELNIEGCDITELGTLLEVLTLPSRSPNLLTNPSLSPSADGSQVNDDLEDSPDVGAFKFDTSPNDEKYNSHLKFQEISKKNQEYKIIDGQKVLLTYVPNKHAAGTTISPRRDKNQEEKQLVKNCKSDNVENVAGDIVNTSSTCQEKLKSETSLAKLRYLKHKPEEIPNLLSILESSENGSDDERKSCLIMNPMSLCKEKQQYTEVKKVEFSKNNTVEKRSLKKNFIRSSVVKYQARKFSGWKENNITTAKCIQAQENYDSPFLSPIQCKNIEENETINYDALNSSCREGSEIAPEYHKTNYNYIVPIGSSFANCQDDYYDLDKNLHCSEEVITKTLETASQVSLNSSIPGKPVETLNPSKGNTDTPSILTKSTIKMLKSERMTTNKVISTSVNKGESFGTVQIIDDVTDHNHRSSVCYEKENSISNIHADREQDSRSNINNIVEEQDGKFSSYSSANEIDKSNIVTSVQHKFLESENTPKTSFKSEKVLDSLTTSFNNYQTSNSRKRITRRVHIMKRVSYKNTVEDSSSETCESNLEVRNKAEKADLLKEDKKEKRDDENFETIDGSVKSFESDSNELVLPTSDQIPVTEENKNSVRLLRTISTQSDDSVIESSSGSGERLPGIDSTSSLEKYTLPIHHTATNTPTRYHRRKHSSQSRRSTDTKSTQTYPVMDEEFIIIPTILKGSYLKNNIVEITDKLRHIHNGAQIYNKDGAENMTYPPHHYPKVSDPSHCPQNSCNLSSFPYKLTNMNASDVQPFDVSPSTAFYSFPTLVTTHASSPKPPLDKCLCVGSSTSCTSVTSPHVRSPDHPFHSCSSTHSQLGEYMNLRFVECMLLGNATQIQLM